MKYAGQDTQLASKSKELPFDSGCSRRAERRLHFLLTAKIVRLYICVPRNFNEQQIYYAPS